MTKPALKFTKMHGCGNDFIMINNIPNLNHNYALLAPKLCQRHFAIGADQLIVLQKSNTADFAMEVYNKDGSQVETCGNALRALALFIHDEKLSCNNQLSIETKNTINYITIENNIINVDMGTVSFKAEDIPLNQTQSLYNTAYKVADKTFNLTTVSIGNPHVVIIVEEDLDKLDVPLYGKLLENDPLFINRVNVEFISIIDKDNIKMRVWERGSGETMACGSGACAALCVASSLNYSNKKANVKLKGGNLTITWQENNHVILSGDAVITYKGKVDAT